MRQYRIPNSWKEVKLGDITDYGRTQKCELSDVPPDTWVLELEDIEKDSSRILKRLDSTERPFKSTKNKFSVGDVLYGKLRPYLNKVVIANNSGVCSTEIIPLNVEPHIDNRFLFYWLKSKTFLDFVNSVSYGVNMPRLGTKDGLRAPFILAPLAEQKVIAHKLDTLLAQVETIKARLERIPEILNTFRQSGLAAAVSGKLTVEWREKFKPEMVDIASISKEQFSTGLTMGNFGKKMDKSPDISGDENGKFVSHIAGWLPIRIGALCECVVPNRDKPKSFSGGYHWLLTPNFDEQSIWIDYKEIESGLSEEEVITYRAKIIKPGNVIMTCVGRVGLSAVLEESSVINQQLHAFKVNSHIKAEYLAYCVRANVEYYESKATSTTVKYLNKTACNSLPIPLPTIEEQDEIVRRVEELFAFADSIEQKTNASLERANKLTQSILAKAFRGELTSDWRAANPELISGENSAEALLAKIKAEREALKPVKKSSVRKKS
jgi:type I restriction enzyme S subunit